MGANRSHSICGIFCHIYGTSYVGIAFGDIPEQIKRIGYLCHGILELYCQLFGCHRFSCPDRIYGKQQYLFYLLNFRTDGTTICLAICSGNKGKIIGRARTKTDSLTIKPLFQVKEIQIKILASK